jgi:spermidine synthase
MIEEATRKEMAGPGKPLVFPLLLLMFAGSGCAALIYEVVWFQLLQLVIGSSAVSLGILLGTYMGGLCLGSIFFWRIVPSHLNPFSIYAALEAAIAGFGILVLIALPWLTRVYVMNPGHGAAGILVRGLISMICLLAPTMLMGATLPAISRWLKATPQTASRVGFLYGANIAGAVFGSLFAGFYLLRVGDMSSATYAAAALNGLLALAGLSLSFGHPVEPLIENPLAASGCAQRSPARNHGRHSTIYIAIGVSGFCALGGEVVWTRLLSLMLGPTVYTFSLIVAVFLVGLGIGSALGSVMARDPARARLALVACQALLMGAIAWTAFMLACSLPYWPVNPVLSSSPWFNFQLDLVRCAWAILPPTICWGASFPLALACLSDRDEDPGRVVGRLYGANTLGAIAGALGTSLLFIPQIGSRQTQALFIVCSALAALILLLPLRGSGMASSRGAWISALAIPGIATLLALHVPAIPWQLVAHGRFLPTYKDNRKILYVGEGLNASLAVTELSDGTRNFHISGKVEASSDPADMRMQRMLAHIPGLVHLKPRSVLVVGCGAGVTAGSFLDYPGLEKIVICEIESLIPQKVTPLFRKQNHDLLHDPRVRLVFDDARHFVSTTREQFDIITSDPIHPWVKGAATLYTREYFEACRRRLRPGGVVAQWIPFYETDIAAVKSELATFFDVFPQGTLWSNDENGEGYDAVVLGSPAPLSARVDGIQELLDANPALAASLSEVGFKSPVSLLATYAGDGAGLKEWLKSAEINRDGNLRLQYLAGMSANYYGQASVLEEVLYYRRYPENLFAGSAEKIQALRLRFKLPRSAP